MKIKMLKSTPGALNGGLTVKMFSKDKVYNSEEMEGLAETFINIGVAEEYTDPEPVIKRREKIMRKMEKDAPQNKAVKPASNKGKVKK